MEFNDIKKIENRVRGSGLTMTEFFDRVGIARGTWYGWRYGSEPSYSAWTKVLKAVDSLEQGEADLDRISGR